MNTVTDSQFTGLAADCEMRKHEYNIFPEASPDDYARLVADMQQNGFDPAFPITVYQGCILDGWNRYRACLELGLNPIFEQFRGNDADALDYTLRTNKRRNLTSSQWAAIAVMAEPTMERLRKQAEERRLATLKQNQTDTVCQLIDEREPPKRRSDAQAAALFNTNRTYIREAEKIRQADPVVFDRVASGQATITQAKRELKEQEREDRREENRAKVAGAESPAAIIKAGARFSTIVIDPPWDWGDEGDQDQLGRARPDYSTMSLSELLDLPVDKLADDDAHIYMWITNRSLPKGFQLLERWGFRYITALTWVKPHFGMGNYFRGQTEHVLFGVKGSLMLNRRDAGTVFSAPRGPNGHSSKPVEFYELVESCSPGPYLEMFSRTKREDWTAWGEGQ